MAAKMAVAAAAGVLAVATAVGALAQGAQRDVFVIVLGTSGQPLVNLPADRFAVREDGVDRTIVRVTPVAEPAHVAVIADTSAFVTATAETYRRDLAAFVARLAAFSHVALYEFGDRPSRLVPFTRDASELDGAVGRLGIRLTGVPRLADTVDLACRDLRLAEAARPVIVVVTFAEADASSTSAGAAIKQLVDQSASLWIVAVAAAARGDSAPSLTSSSGRSELDRRQRLNQLSATGEGNRELTRLVEQGPTKTGGSLQRVAGPLAIGAALGRAASELAATHRLTYERPGTGESRDLQVGVFMDDVTIRAIAAPSRRK